MSRAALVVARTLLISALPALYFAYVFRLPDGTPARAGLGDWLDPYFINYLLEHWYYSVTTFSDPRSPLMYFPIAGTLGYSHSLILYAPFYIGSRLFVDPFQAYSLTLALVFETGTVCLYLLLRRVGLRWFEAAVLCAFFVTSANIINGVTGTWSQTATVFLIPPILLMLVTSLRMPDGRARLVLASASGLFGGLILAQEYYTGAFAAILLVLCVVLPVAISRELAVVRRTVARSVGAFGRAAFASVTPLGEPSRWWLVIAGVFTFAAVVLSVYPLERTEIGPLRFSARDPWRAMYIALPAALWYAGRRWHLLTRLRRGVPAARDGVTPVGTALTAALRATLPGIDSRMIGAILIGGAASMAIFLAIYLRSYFEHPAFPQQDLLNQLQQPDSARWVDLQAFYRDLRGFDTLRPFWLTLSVVIFGWLALRGDRRARLYSLWFLVVSTMIATVPLRIGDLSFWTVFFGWWPGMSVIRGVKRIIYLYELAVVLVAAFVMTRAPARSWLRHAVVVVALVLLFVDWNTWAFEYKRPRYFFQEWVLGDIKVDPSCRSFFIKGASERYMSRADNKWGLYGMDSMFIAMKYSIPTLNGYSAWTPEEWRLANPHEPDYMPAVNDWIARNDLRNVCALDIDARTMVPYVKP